MRYLIAALLILPGLASTHAAELLSGLSPAERHALELGKQVVHFEEISGKPWPKISVYQIVLAKPEEVAAVFADYEDAKEFVPNVTRSSIDQRHSAQVADVTYHLAVPLLPDEQYTARNEFCTEAAGYRFDWKILRSLQAKEGTGHLQIQPHSSGALIRYTNLVVPTSGVAGILRGLAIKQTQQTVDAICDHVEKQRTRRPADLQKQVEAFRVSSGN